MEESKPQLDAQQTASLLLGHLKKGKETHDLFAISFRKLYKIADKTIEEWENHFKIAVPANPNPAVCKMLDMELMSLHQEASSFHAEASARTQALQKGSDTEYRARYTALVQEYNISDKKLPARGTLEDLCRSETDNIEGALVNSTLQKEFWANMMKHLDTCRKLLENATINSGIEAKMAMNHGGNLYDTKRASSGSGNTNDHNGW